jgi:hypothetical protein
MKSEIPEPVAEPVHKTVVLALILPLLLAGCVTKAKADAQARAAFTAGQQEALRAQQGPQQPQSGATQKVTIMGQVKNPVLPWQPGLTLAQAILDAGYSGSTDPTDVLVVRNGVATRVEVDKLLTGQDLPLLPGDLVQIK